MKTKEELRELKSEYEKLSAKLNELSEEELDLVTGGAIGDWIELEADVIDAQNKGKYIIKHGAVIDESPEISGGQHQR